MATPPKKNHSLLSISEKSARMSLPLPRKQTQARQFLSIWKTMPAIRSDDEDSMGSFGLVAYVTGMVASDAWQQMGLIADPSTGKVNADMNQARFSIDCVTALVGVLEKYKDSVPAELLRDLQRVLERPQAQFRGAAVAPVGEAVAVGALPPEFISWAAYLFKMISDSTTEFGARYERRSLRSVTRLKMGARRVLKPSMRTLGAGSRPTMARLPPGSGHTSTTN